MERKRQALSEINVIPFVDVMLVLLVIFMITAPFLQYGIDVNLPQAKGKELPSTERIILTIKSNGKIYINGTHTDIAALRSKLAGSANREVFLKADKTVPYGLVVEVMGELREAGIEKLGMVTEPRALLR
ncbi:MAG TPA: protein TolR [Nitrospiraceae bacterium]|nr:protein TolR [Nitrospiraceae bacterium]